MSTSYSPKIVTDGLVLALDAANPKSYPRSGTTWSDLSGNNNSGSLISGPTFNGANGGSIVFDGTDDYAEIPNVATSKNCTISFWFRDNSPSNFRNILTFQAAVDSNASRIERSSNPYEYMSFRGGFVDTTVLFYHTPDTFDFITLTFDAANAKCYKNGVLTQNTISTNFGAASTIRLGTRLPGNFQCWSGRIACVSIYNRPLSQSEIQQNFNATRNRFGV